MNEGAGRAMHSGFPEFWCKVSAAYPCWGWPVPGRRPGKAGGRRQGSSLAPRVEDGRLVGTGHWALNCGDNRARV